MWYICIWGLFKYSNVHILDRGDRWFGRRVKEAIYVHWEQPSLKGGDGWSHRLSATYGAVPGALPRRFGPRSHLDPRDMLKSHVGGGDDDSLMTHTLAKVTLMAHTMGVFNHPQNHSPGVIPTRGMYLGLPCSFLRRLLDERWNVLNHERNPVVFNFST